MKKSCFFGSPHVIRQILNKMHGTNNNVKLWIRVQCHVLRPPDPLTVTMLRLYQTMSTKTVSCQTSTLLTHMSKTYNSLHLANFMVQCILS